MTQAQKIGVGVAILAILGAVALGIYGNSRTASPLENAEIYVEPAADAAPVKIYVHVTGAVRAPDVYELPVEARAWQAVQAAGGLLENADEASANLAAPLSAGPTTMMDRVGQVGLGCAWMACGALLLTWLVISLMTR